MSSAPSSSRSTISSKGHHLLCACITIERGHLRPGIAFVYIPIDHLGKIAPSFPFSVDICYAFISPFSPRLNYSSSEFRTLYHSSDSLPASCVARVQLICRRTTLVRSSLLLYSPIIQNVCQFDLSFISKCVHIPSSFISFFRYHPKWPLFARSQVLREKDRPPGQLFSTILVTSSLRNHLLLFPIFR